MGLKKQTLFLAAFLLVGSNSSWAAKDWIYGVIQGDTLSEFSKKYLRSDIDWRQVQVLNNISNPDLILPTTKIRVPASWLKEQPSSALVIAVKGDVWLRRSKTEENNEPLARPLNLGDQLQLGDMITTGENSSVAVRFADDSTVSLSQNAELIFDHMSAHEETGMVDSRLRLMKGTAETEVTRQLAGPARFEIHTPSAISAVRGTSFRTTYQQQEDAARVEVLHGGVAVQAKSVTELVEQGFGTKVKKGEAPIKPRELLPAPELARLPEVLTQINHNFRWQGHADSTAYRFQIAEHKSFNALIWEKVQSGSELFFPELSDGGYFVRLRSIDDIGIEGHSQIKPVTINLTPLPPVPIRYSGQGGVIGNNFELRWTIAPQAARYRLQIAKDAGFKQRVVDKTDLPQAYDGDLRIDQDGDYYWRVASISADGEQGEFSQITPLSITRTHSILQDDWLYDRQKVHLSWPSLTGEAYQVQVAEDPEFKQLLLDRRQNHDQLTLKRYYKPRYLRVASASQQTHGKWGEVHVISPSQSLKYLPGFSWFAMVLAVL